MMKQLVEPVHGYESQPQRVFEQSFSLCVSNDLKQPVVPIENMHTLNDLSLTLIPAGRESNASNAALLSSFLDHDKLEAPP